MLAIAISTSINGISVMAVDLFAAIIGVKYIVQYFQKRKSLMPFVSILGWCWVVNYLGPLVTFWSLVITGHNIDPTLYFILSYTIPPISIMNAIWLGFEIFSPNKKKKVFSIFLISGVIYYIAEFGWTNLMFRINGDVNQLNANGQMIDMSVLSIIQLLCLCYILSAMFIIGGGFLWLRKRTKGVDRKRATYIFIGYIIAGFAVLLETTLGSLGDVFKIIARVMMATYLAFIYLGFKAKATAELEAPPTVTNVNSHTAEEYS